MTQFARPASDISLGTWSVVPGGTAASVLDESTASDTDYVQSGNWAFFGSDVFEVKLGAITAPGAGSVTIKWRYEVSLSLGWTFQVDLVQGATVKATKAVTGFTDSGNIDDSYTLTGPEVAAISDWTDLRLRFTVSDQADSGTADAAVFWADLEAPDAGAAGSLDYGVLPTRGRRWRPYRGPRRRLYASPPAFEVSAAAPTAYTAPGATGGLVFSGTSGHSFGKTPSASGGLLFASTSLVSFAKVFSPSGGLVFGGAAALVKSHSYAPSGGLVFGGSAAVDKTVTPVPAGGLVFGGTAQLVKSKVFAPDGGVAFAGAAPLAKAKVFAPAGGVVFAGAGATAIGYAYSYAPSGGLVFAGASNTALGHAYVAPAATGGLAFAGEAPTSTQVSSLPPPGGAIGRAAWSVGRYPWHYKPAPQPQFTPGKSYTYGCAGQLGPFAGSAECSWKIQPVDFIGQAQAKLPAFGGNAAASFYSAARKRREESELLRRLW